MIIRFKSERFSPLQTVLILSLSEKPMTMSEILAMFKSKGVKSRSSIYTAIYELEKRGIVRREISEEGDIIVKLTNKGLTIANEIPEILDEQLYPLIRIINTLLGCLRKRMGEIYSIAEALEEPEELIEYKKFLHRELEKVEEKIKHWRKVPVE